MFWDQLHKIEPLWAEHVLLFVEQQQYDVASRTRARERYRAACNAMFSEDFRAGILRRLADVLDNQEFPWDTDPSSRYASLFRYHGDREHDIKRQSYLEHLAAQGKSRLVRVLRDLLRTAAASATRAAPVVDEVRFFAAVGDRALRVPKKVLQRFGLCCGDESSRECRHACGWCKTKADQPNRK